MHAACAWLYYLNCLVSKRVVVMVYTHIRISLIIQVVKHVQCLHHGHLNTTAGAPVP